MENLKALVYKGDLTPYQRALAQREFEGMVERLEIYEKVVKNNAVLPLVSNPLSCDGCKYHNTTNDDLCGACGNTYKNKAT